MKLLIMRHGEAGWHAQDERRELTDAGRQQVARVAAQLAEGDFRPELIWCSPLVRARQTAAIVAERLNCPIEEKLFITPDDDPARCLDALLVNTASPLLLVSHMPLVRGLHEILYGNASVRAVINGLMTAAQNSDVEFILPRTIVQ